MTDVSGPTGPKGHADDEPEDDGLRPDAESQRPADEQGSAPDDADAPTEDAPVDEDDYAEPVAQDLPIEPHVDVPSDPPVLPSRSHDRREDHDGPISIELSSQPGGPQGAGGSGDDDEDFERPGGLLSRIDGHMVIYHQPRSLQSEQYRAFRANLVAMNRSGAPWAIVVTSARKGEGKSVSAANLAACLAELPGSRVCIVDVDSRSPSQADLLGCTPRLGVTEYLEGKGSLNEALMVTLLPGLDCIHSGREPTNPAELLGGERFANLLGELKRRYSWIVIDAPPANPYTDPCVVAAQTDGAILVVQLMTAPKELVNSSVDAIRNAGGTVLGTFVTGLTPDTEDDAEVAGYERISSDERATIRKAAEGDKERKKEQRDLARREKAAFKRQKKAAKLEGRDEEHPV
jgi:capsular exopolysaccharide synthesis family protein